MEKGPLISILIPCYSRQEQLDVVLPLWLAQKDINFEVCVGAGPSIKVEESYRNPVVKRIPLNMDKFGLCKAYNKLINSAKGDLLLITQCDIKATSPHNIKNMLDKWRPRWIVNENMYNNGKKKLGLYLQCTLVEKSAVEKIGGFCELFDDNRVSAYEDGDVMASLFERGYRLTWNESEEGKGVEHMPHERPDYKNHPVWKWKVENAKKLYFERHNRDFVKCAWASQFATYFRKIGRLKEIEETENKLGVEGSFDIAL